MVNEYMTFHSDPGNSIVRDVTISNAMVSGSMLYSGRYMYDSMVRDSP